MAHTQYKNDPLEASYQRKFNAAQLVILNYLARHTWGYADRESPKKRRQVSDPCSAKVIAHATGYGDRRIQQSLRQLETAGVLICHEKAGRQNQKGSRWAVNADVKQWQVPFREPQHTGFRLRPTAQTCGRSASNLPHKPAADLPHKPAAIKRKTFEIKEEGEGSTIVQTRTSLASKPSPPLLKQYQIFFQEAVGTSLTFSDFVERDFHRWEKQCNEPEEVKLEAWRRFIFAYMRSEYLQRENPLKCFITRSTAYIKEAQACVEAEMEVEKTGTDNENVTVEESAATGALFDDSALEEEKRPLPAVERGPSTSQDATNKAELKLIHKPDPPKRRQKEDPADVLGDPDYRASRDEAFVKMVARIAENKKSWNISLKH